MKAIDDRRERAPRYEYRTHILSGLLASPSPPSSPSRLPCSHLASFPPRLSGSIFTKENVIQEIVLPYNEINKCNRFSNFHINSISKINAFFSAFYILV
jgi:hypothetical protein